MTMEQALQNFKTRIGEAHHLTNFLSKKALALHFLANDTNYYVTINGNEVTSTTEEPEQIDLHIEGEETIIKKILKGESQLQLLQKQKEVIITGDYSTILRAETIFYLN